MNNVFAKLQKEAREYSNHKRPSFYEYLAPEHSNSRETFFEHPLMLRCFEDVTPFLDHEFGHGIEHSQNVAIEAGTITLAETKQTNSQANRHLTLLAQISGLLHDICRMEKDHAVQGAKLSFEILKDYPLSDKDKQMISFAIANHEAFKQDSPAPDYSYELLSGALYDADKFRWGPDNFVTTMWEICDYQEWTLDNILERFPNAFEIINSISETFKTPTGQIFGPEFIEIGLELGNYLYRRMKQIYYYSD